MPIRITLTNRECEIVLDAIRTKQDAILYGADSVSELTEAKELGVVIVKLEEASDECD